MSGASVLPITCPRCGHQQAGGSADCGGCGVILAKAAPIAARRHARTGVGQPGIGRSGTAAPPATSRFSQSPTLVERAGELLLRDEAGDRVALAGRAVVWLGLLVWSWSFAAASIASNAAGASWLHLVDLVFHEAGHMLFMPFGQFVMTLGGSLTQLLLPAALMIVFLTRHRDPFGAAVCWWWTGQNLIDLAPYVNDARALRLVLLGGRTGAEVEGHDWARILMTLGWLHHDHTLARAAHAIGTLIMISACVWAALLIAAHWRRSRTRTNGA